MTHLALRYVALTDVGLRRSNNQDSGYASDRLLVVADGMGGAAAGDLASSEALGAIRRVDRELEDDALEALEVVVEAANRRLGDLIEADPAVEGMGTTIEAMLWDGEKFAVAHLGDSRAYRLRGGRLVQLSTDHTFVQSLVDEGKLSRAEARTHPHRSLLLRAMLGRDDNAADYSWLQPQLGDRYLLCSDGLSDMVDDEAIERSLTHESIDVAATELIRLALERGGHDNVTVVIGEMVEAESLDEHSELSCADGRPQIVGAASDAPRPRTGQVADVHDSTAALAVDPEELRYAPLEPSRWRSIRWIAFLLAVALLIGAALWFGYRWTQEQYFVAESDGTVAIYRGINADVPGITLRHVETRSDVEVDDLATFQRRQIRDGIEVSSLSEAEQIVEDLRDSIAPETPAPTPTPAPDPAAPPAPAPGEVPAP
jgi:protein phosphatase